MRRYAITQADLEAAIGDRWLRRARERTERFRQAGRYEEALSLFQAAVDLAPSNPESRLHLQPWGHGAFASPSCTRPHHPEKE